VSDSTPPVGEQELAKLMKLQPEGQPLPAHKPKVPALVPVPYTVESLITWLVEHPEASPAVVAKEFGRPKSWFLQTLASNQFQQALDPVRHLLTDPEVTATMEERFRSLTLHSLSVLHKKLEHPEAGDALVLKATEIGVKALGMGQPEAPAAGLTSAANVDTLAERLVAALEKQRKNVRAPVTVDAEVVPAEPPKDA